MCGAVTVGRRILISSEDKKARTEATTTTTLGIGTDGRPMPRVGSLIAPKWLDGYLAVFFLESKAPFRSITHGNVFRSDTIKTKPRSYIPTGHSIWLFSTMSNNHAYYFKVQTLVREQGKKEEVKITKRRTTLSSKGRVNIE